MVDEPVHTMHVSGLKLQFFYQCSNFSFISLCLKLCGSITKKQFNIMMVNTDTMIILRAIRKFIKRVQGTANMNMINTSMNNEHILTLLWLIYLHILVKSLVCLA